MQCRLYMVTGPGSSLIGRIYCTRHISEPRICWSRCILDKYEPPIGRVPEPRSFMRPLSASESWIFVQPPAASSSPFVASRGNLIKRLRSASDLLRSSQQMEILDVPIAAVAQGPRFNPDGTLRLDVASLEREESIYMLILCPEADTVTSILTVEADDGVPTRPNWNWQRRDTKVMYETTRRTSFLLEI